MNLPFTLPDWLPPWAFLLIALPVLLYALVFLLMPFSVFGLKSRLETLEAQLDALHEEIRGLGGRSGGFAAAPVRKPAVADDYDDLPDFSRLKSTRRPAEVKPPVTEPAPPAAEPRPRMSPAISPPQPPQPRITSRRTEPRLD